ncbi:MAG: bacillithiol biosynthesis deacetylase BshB1 [Candidatus Hydrogenedentes bacterium]|nr:bacillithiol biosynthesis deacetylase BshB1 [Candidatus Hydrogenedentota bacterium]
MTLDVLAVGAHPDDADLGVGGTLLKLARAGFSVGILDLSRGEMGTRGTVDERVAEAAAAAKLLNLCCRECAGLPDGAIADTDAQRQALIPILRRLRPRMLLAPMAPDRHPDHAAAHALVTSANFLAGLSRIESGAPPHRANQVWYYYAYHEGTEQPLFVVDISDEFAGKLEALRAHASQFHNPGRQDPQTYVSSESFWQSIEIRSAYWGHRIGKQYGEPFFGSGPLGLHLLPGLDQVQPNAGVFP